jgi:hypothetical protein
VVRWPCGCAIAEWAPNSRGYPKFEGRTAARVVWEWLVGPIPRTPRMEIDHCCPCPHGKDICCVELRHLRLVTKAGNVELRWDWEQPEGEQLA